MGFWPVLGIIVAVCIVIRLLSPLFSEAPIVASVLAEILLIVELILVIKFKNLTAGMTASVNKDKEMLEKEAFEKAGRAETVESLKNQILDGLRCVL